MINFRTRHASQVSLTSKKIEDIDDSDEDNQFDTDQFVVAPPRHKPPKEQKAGENSIKATASPKSDTTQNTKKTFNSFRSYLDLIKTDGIKYDIQDFKTCTDKKRKDCAQLMIDFVVSHPQNINEYANLTRDIITSGSLSSTVHKTFIMHLIDIINIELNKHFQKGTVKKWNDFTNIGTFLAQIFKRDVLKPSLLYKWLDGVYGMIRFDPNAPKAYISVLYIVVNGLAMKDKGTYRIHMTNLSNLSSQGKIPQQYSQWTSMIFSRNQQSGMLSKASSMSSVKSETTTTSSAPAPIQPTATTKICTKFQNYLNTIEAGKAVIFDAKQLEPCTEAVARGCALILVEHSTLYPKNAKIYAAITANGILSKISQKELFVQRVSLCFDVELDKWLKLESPEKSNWDRIKNVGAFLSELYNFDVVDILIVGNWIGNIQQAVVMNSKPAIEATMNVYKSVSAKMKLRDANTFNTYMYSAEFSKDEKLIAVNFSKMLNDAIKFKGAKIPTQVQSPTSTFIPQATRKNVFEEMQRLVNVKMNFGNSTIIIDDVVALKIPGTEENMRKITNSLVSRAKQRPDLVASLTQVLAKLPEKAGYGETGFRNQVRLSINQQFDYICSRSSVEREETMHFINFIKELHLRSAIGLNVVSRIVENIGVKAKNDPKVSLQVLLMLIKVNLSKFLPRKLNIKSFFFVKGFWRTICEKT